MPVLILIGMVTSVVSSLGAPLLETIARVDHVTLGVAQWSLTATMVVGAVTAPVLGRLGDGPHRRIVIFTALGGIVVGSALAALPFGGFALLLVGRGLQGLGLGLMPLTMAVARDSLPPERSARAISILSIATAAGAGLGYPITGLLDDSFGLHDTFWFGVVAGLVAIAFSWFHIPASDHIDRRPLDVIGSSLLGGALVALLIAVTEGQPWGWTSVSIIGLLVAAVVLLWAWVARELRTRHPLVEVRLLRHASLAVTNLSALLIAVAMYIYVPLFVDLMQTPRRAGYGLGESILVTGLMLVPFSVLSTTMSRVAAVVGTRIGQERIVPIGAAITVVAIGLMAFRGNTLWEGFLDMGIAGIGIGFSFAAMPGLIVRSVPPEETGSALGFYQVVRYVGFSLGSGIAATILAVYTTAGHELPRRAGYTVSFIVGAGICLFAAGLSAILTRSKQLGPADELRVVATETGALTEAIIE